MSFVGHKNIKNVEVTKKDVVVSSGYEYHSTSVNANLHGEIIVEE